MTILGILNLTTDSFSDGGRYLDFDRAISHARDMRGRGAGAIDVGAAASNPSAAAVSPDEEIRRLEPVIDRLRGERVPVSVDSASTHVQRFAMSRGVEYLNDVAGFPDESFYPELAAGTAKLVVVHTLSGPTAAPRPTAPGDVSASLRRFFDERVAALTDAGVARERLVLDPGMGLFLGTGPGPSVEALRSIRALRERYGLPVLVSVSRKSFLRELTGRPVGERGPATLAAELFAVGQGARYVRTHDPGALRDALLVWHALDGEEAAVDLK